MVLIIVQDLYLFLFRSITFGVVRILILIIMCSFIILHRGEESCSNKF